MTGHKDRYDLPLAPLPEKKSVAAKPAAAAEAKKKAAAPKIMKIAPRSRKIK
jgi:hypothetical protein